LQTLLLVSDQPEAVIVDALWPALQVGLLARQGTTYRLLHDRIQEAAYALTPLEERVAMHLQIGRLLRDRIPDLEDHLFDIVTHLNQGIELLSDPRERLQTAELNLRAGMKARSATVFTAAAAYFAAGLALLPDDAWVQHYQLAFDLYR